MGYTYIILQHHLQVVHHLVLGHGGHFRTCLPATKLENLRHSRTGHAVRGAWSQCGCGSGGGSDGGGCGSGGSWRLNYGLTGLATDWDKNALDFGQLISMVTIKRRIKTSRRKVESFKDEMQ